MIRLAIASTVLTLGVVSAAYAVAPAAPPAGATAATAAQKVVEVYVGGGYYRPRYHPRYYPRYGYYPWYRPYAFGGPFYEPLPPVVVITQPPPQPVWTGAGVIWMFPGGAPQ